MDKIRLKRTGDSDFCFEGEKVACSESASGAISYALYRMVSDRYVLHMRCVQTAPVAVEDSIVCDFASLQGVVDFLLDDDDVGSIPAVSKDLLSQAGVSLPEPKREAYR